MARPVRTPGGAARWGQEVRSDMAAVVRTAGGLVRGVAVGGGVTAFRGVPYGRARRFAAPGPATGWAGVRDAREPGPAAPQWPSRLEPVTGTGGGRLAQSEDCLTVNIWTPAEVGEGAEEGPGGPGGPAGAGASAALGGPDAGAGGASGAGPGGGAGVGRGGLPVMVWLHGGGFASGSGGEAFYEGGLLAGRGRMVVVTVNYRLGALGYAYLGEEFGPANLGLLDQLAALRWVREQAAAFGGDPGRVTLAGQSAGALSVLALLALPAAEGLFAQAVLESAPAGVAPYSAGRAAGNGRRFLELLGVGPSAEGARAARDVAVGRVLDAQRELGRERAEALSVTPPLQLVAAGGLPRDLVAAARRDVPLLVGTARDEARAFFPGEPPEVLAEVTARRFAEPSLRLAERSAEGFAYRFDWAPEGSPLGPCHCVELPFVFGAGVDAGARDAAWRAAPLLAGAEPAELRRLTEEVQSAWASFVHTGAPGGTGWPAAPQVRRFS